MMQNPIIPADRWKTQKVGEIVQKLPKETIARIAAHNIQKEIQHARSVVGILLTDGMIVSGQNFAAICRMVVNIGHEVVSDHKILITGNFAGETVVLDAIRTWP